MQVLLIPLIVPYHRDNFSLRVTIGLLLYVAAIWVGASVSAFLHELGHGIGYKLGAGKHVGGWHIVVGSHKPLLITRSITIKLLPFGGWFLPKQDGIPWKRSNVIKMLVGGPMASLVVIMVLCVCLITCETGPSVVQYIRFMMYYNLFAFVLSIAPLSIPRGGSDGLKIFKVLSSRKIRFEWLMAYKRNLKKCVLTIHDWGRGQV